MILSRELGRVWRSIKISFPLQRNGIFLRKIVIEAKLIEVMACADDWENDDYGVRIDINFIQLLRLNRIYEMPSSCVLKSLEFR